MSTQTALELSKAFDSLKLGKPLKAKNLLEDILPGDLENKDVIFTLKCTNFWCPIIDHIQNLPDAYQKGENYLEQWKNFVSFISKEKTYISEPAMYACKRGIFSLALDSYKSILADHVCSHRQEILSKTGLCLKILGDYETALRFLNEANALMPNTAEILAAMADCYALCGEEKTAKVLFREAYFIDASKIDDDFLESELINRLIEQVAQLGYKGEVLKEWIPVYGVLFGIFTVKRELRALEVGKLRQSIFALENELKEARSDPSLLIPRLINHYFWLIDHYVTIDGERVKINENLLKIKLLDPTIYEKYTL
jgi:tetratricopeptide (TPR) repeat protein